MNDSVRQVTPEKFPRGRRNALAALFVAVLALTVTAQWLFVPHPHDYFGVDSALWFYPAMGLMSSMVMVLVSRFLGFLLKRRETYWEEKS